MNRRAFLRSSIRSSILAGTGVAAGSVLGAARTARAESPGTITAGHLVGICMSPLFYADAMGLFREEGLDVKLKWMPNPGDSITALASGAVQFIHNPFTNSYVAASKGAPVKIIAGSGAGGLVVIAQKATGLRTMADLKKKVGTEFTVGSQRVNTLELTFYRNLVSHGMKYDDFRMVWFTDHFAMASAFQAGKVDLVTHVEPYATMLVDKHGGVPLATNIDAWGKNAPDCVVSVHADFTRKYPETTRKYLRAVLKADRAIKADTAKAVEILDRGKYYKVDGPTLRAALPRQMPQIDLLDAARGMELAISDMVTLRYLTRVPEGVLDFAALRDVLRA